MPTVRVRKSISIFWKIWKETYFLLDLHGRENTHISILLDMFADFQCK